jgi:hypothetical protein
MQVKADGADASNKLSWRADTTDGYLGGQVTNSFNSGVDWTVGGGYDYMFEIYGIYRGDVPNQPEPLPPVVPSTEGWDDFEILYLLDFENSTLGKGQYWEGTDETTGNTTEFDTTFNYPVAYDGELSGLWESSQWDQIEIKDTTMGGRPRSRVMKAEYHTTNRGWNFFSWYIPIVPTITTECLLSYDVMCMKDFDDGKSMKMPGFDGKPNGEPLVPLEWDNAFANSLLHEGKTGGDQGMRFYLYHLDAYEIDGEIAGESQYDEVEMKRNRQWDSTWTYDTEHWMRITIRIKINSATATAIGGPDGSYDGFEEAFMGKKYVDGFYESYVAGYLGGQPGLRFRNLATLGVTAIKFHVFSSSTVRPSKDEWILFDNICLWRYSDDYLTNNPDVPHGFKHWDQDTIYTPLDLIVQ